MPVKNKDLMLLWEEVSARRNICKNCKDLWGFVLQVRYEWIPFSVTFRYHSRKVIPHNVATKCYTDQYICKSIEAIRDWYKNIPQLKKTL